MNRLRPAAAFPSPAGGTVPAPPAPLVPAITRLTPMKRIVASSVVCSLCLAFGASAATITLTTTVRDFKYAGTVGGGGHPDFESVIASDPGIVATTLPASKDPTYTGIAGNPTTHGAGPFDMWYGGPAVVGIDPGIPFSVPLTLTETAPGSGIYSNDSSAYFPIDGLGYGNQGFGHNYHFTLETHTEFTYVAGQEFSFTGDDDVWVFINNELVIDLGGVHGPASATVDLDLLGLTVGETYDFDFYFAERHTVGSNLKITTSIALEENPESVPEGGSTLPVFAAALLGLFGTHRWMKSRRSR
jgi:fibro-slime domain-containing protein